jgi:hypothetical protein
MIRAGMFALVLALAGCGGKQTTGGTGPGSAGEAAPARDTRTPLEQRRGAACDQLTPKLWTCAVEDARKDVDAGKTTQADFAKDTSPDFQRAHRAKWEKGCKGAQMSSRQVRVLEVCFREEHDCDPLAECLKNLQPPTK